MRHTTSSAYRRTVSRLSGAATGTAQIRRAGRRERTACSAAIMVAPVASPSSTTTTVRPAGSRGIRPGVKRCRRDCRMSRWRSISACRYAALAPTSSAYGARQAQPVSSTAPTANPGLPGAPSLRTMTTSRSPPSASSTRMTHLPSCRMIASPGRASRHKGRARQGATAIAARRTCAFHGPGASGIAPSVVTSGGGCLNRRLDHAGTHPNRP